MPLKRVPGDRILSVAIDPDSDLPVYRQVYLGVRQAIVRGTLEPGARLPSTRALAADLGISRNTVVVAYEQLRGEGYAVGRGGSDTRVARTIPDRVMRAEATPRRPRQAVGIARVSESARAIERAWVDMAPPLDRAPRAFRAGFPATDLFPYAIWGRLLARRWSRITSRDLGYGSAQGHIALREAIASYVASARSVHCTPEQVFVVGGAQGALAVAARLALDPGDAVWIEDPGYHGARGALLAAGARLVPVPVDAQGLRVDEGVRLAPQARAAFVTPSRQLPLGVSMSRERRQALLAWAARARAWIIEDDYDSELRYASRPLPAMQGEDSRGTVLYVGTFSKMLFPALRLGYLIVPPDLVSTTVAVRHMHDVHAPTLEQMVLADFIEGGHFERHVRRVRQVYLERQQALRESVRRHLTGILDIRPDEAGLFITGWLHGIPDVRAARAAATLGVDVMPLSRLAEATLPPGLVLGYAGLNVTDIAEGVERLARALLPLAGRRH